MLRSIAVVLGSYLLSVVLVFATNPLLSRVFPGEFAAGHVPSDAALAASTALFIVVSVLCAAVCARFAPIPVFRHVLWFFVLGEAMGLVATIASWGNGWPHWYALAWLFSWPASSWLGFVLARRGRGPITTAA
jgi:hypothetical protein